MAKLQMKKIEIIALTAESKNMIERLQRRGAVELTDETDEKIVRINTNSMIALIERNLNTAESALEYLRSCSRKKKSLLGELNGREEISTKQFAQRKTNTDKTLSLCRQALDYEKKINESESEIAKSQTQIDTLKPWLDLDMPQGFRGTKTTDTFIGTMQGEVDEEYVEQAADAPAAVDIVSKSREQTCMAVTCHKSSADAYNNLRENGFVRISGSSRYTPREECDRLKKRIEKYKADISEYESKLENLAAYISDVEFLADFLTMRLDKYKAIGKLGMTENTVIIKGYIPQKYVKGLTEEFGRKYTAAISISEPEPDEDVPVKLENGPFSEPVEGITAMYALPNKRDVDPSSVMAFFYYLFFGMMLSDAGYGVMMLIGTTVALKKFKVEGALKRSLKMFRNCGVSTLFWGILFGSWFGDLPQVIASNFFGKEIATTALWFEPINDPIKLLLFSFALGIAHLFLGLAVNFKILWKEGRRFDAFSESVPIYLTILGVAPMGASILADVPPMYINVGKYLAIVGAVLILLTSGRNGKNIFMRFFGGIYGLYNIATGYLSDILSYSRLLALGLATGSIASVINLIGTMPGNTAVKAVTLIVVGTVGHIANMGINLLGAYVHADRLQFVELFSKFYEGGGRAFDPLKANTKYIKFEKENIYE